MIFPPLPAARTPIWRLFAEQIALQIACNTQSESSSHTGCVSATKCPIEKISLSNWKVERRWATGLQRTCAHSFHTFSRGVVVTCSLLIPISTHSKSEIFSCKPPPLHSATSHPGCRTGVGAAIFLCSTATKLQFWEGDARSHLLHYSIPMHKVEWPSLCVCNWAGDWLGVGGRQSVMCSVAKATRENWIFEVPRKRNFLLKDFQGAFC